MPMDGAHSANKPAHNRHRADDICRQDLLPFDPIAVGPPNGGYGWVVVGCLSSMNAVSWGMNSTYGIYISYYLQNQHFEGGTAFSYAWVGGAAVASALIVAPAVKALRGCLSHRTQLLIGTVCVSGGQAGAGFSTSFLGFAMLQGVIFGLGMGFILVPVQPLIGQWFHSRISLAQGIVHAGSGLGGLIFAQTTRLTLEHLGVKWSLITNGVASFAVLLPCSLLVRQRQSSAGLPDNSKHNRVWSLTFACICLWGALSMMSFFIALFTAASFMTNGLGQSQTSSAVIQSTFSGGMILGRLGWGWLLGRYGCLEMCTLSAFITGTSCFALWLPSRWLPTFTVFVVVNSLCSGVVWSTAASVIGASTGPDGVQTATQHFWAMMIIPALIAQPCASALVDFSKSTLGLRGVEAYRISIGLCGGLAFAASTMLAFACYRLRRPSLTRL